MELLNECLTLRRKINSIDEEIQTLHQLVLSPKGQVITGMPRGGKTINAIEHYIVRTEELKANRQQLKTKLCVQWDIVDSKLLAAGIDSNSILLMRFRFFYGFSWKECGYKMKRATATDNWNKYKIFSTYRKVLRRLEAEYEAQKMD